MKILSLRHPPKRQSFWRALLAGVIAHPLIAIVLSIVYWALRPFIWAAIYMEPYRPPVGLYSPDSGEWLFTQCIGFFASVGTGVASAYWSPPKSHWPIVALLIMSFAYLAFTKFPLETSMFRNAIYALNFPVGLILGVLLLRRLQVNGKHNNSIVSLHG